MHRVRSYLNGVVAELRWAERLSEWNHVPHFPYCVTHCADSMPIASIGGILCDVLFNPKYAGCVYKVTVAIDILGNTVWICPLAPGTSADVLIWDRGGPKRVKGHYMDYEIDSMDGAYKGRLHVAWPFIGRKMLTERQKEYNDVHSFYRARIEHLFARMWHWGIVRNIWRGSGTEWHEYVRVLLHLQQFFIRRQVRYPPYGPCTDCIDTHTCDNVTFL